MSTELKIVATAANEFEAELISRGAHRSRDRVEHGARQHRHGRTFRWRGRPRHLRSQRGLRARQRGAERNAGSRRRRRRARAEPAGSARLRHASSRDHYPARFGGRPSGVPQGRGRSPAHGPPLIAAGACAQGSGPGTIRTKGKNRENPYQRPPARRLIRRGTAGLGVCALGASAATPPTMSIAVTATSATVTGAPTTAGAVNVVVTDKGLKEGTAILFRLNPGKTVAEAENSSPKNAGEHDPNNTVELGSIVFDAEAESGVTQRSTDRTAARHLRRAGRRQSRRTGVA